ncbi:MAG: TolC family outer membrane protein [Nevskia sp.]|nr:TolC family outer membrane protein [Nevskia sp.]
MRRLLIGTLSAVALAAPAVACANDLMDVYRLAKDQDQTYQAAQHQRDASVEVRPQAWSYVLPQVTGQAAIDHDRLHVLSSNQSGSSSLNGGGSGGTPSPASSAATQYYSTRGYSVNLSQALFNWSAFATLAQSSRQVAEAEATLEAARQGLIGRTASAYFAVLSALDTLRADLDAQTSFKQQLDQAQKKFEVGLAAITDVRNAQASYDTATATVIADRTALDNAKRALGLIIGKPVDTVASLQEEIPLVAPNPVSVDDWSNAAAKDNPTLMSAYYAAEAARKQIEVYRGAYLPTLSAVGSTGRQTSHSAFGDDAITDVVGLSLNWNIFQGGLVTSQVRQARASYDQAQAQYELQHRTVDQNTRNDYEGVISGIASVRANRQAVLSNQTSLDATIVGLRVGTRTEIDVLNARQALAAAQKSYYQSRYTYLNSTLALKQDAGRISEQDLADIDRLLVTDRSTLPPPPSTPSPQ